MTLDVSEGKFTDGDSVYLHYFNDKTGELELVGESTYISGFAVFEMEHCSDHIVIAQKLDSTDNTDKKPVGDEEKTSGNITKPSAEVKAPAAQGSGAAKATVTKKVTTKSAKTGDNTPIIPFVVILTIDLVAVVTFLARKKKA